MIQFRSVSPRRSSTRAIISIAVVAQLACTSLWFAGNAVLPDLQALWNLPAGASGVILSAVQIGFVVGTLLFAVYSLSDRFQAPTVFCVCAVLGALSNLFVLASGDVLSLTAARFMTGFFLAGVYPVGMKIAASWCEAGLGRALGYLVGALVVGTALPHLIRGLGADIPWAHVVVMCSALSVLGGVAVYLWVPAGPYLPVRSPFNPSALPKIFSAGDLRAAAFGYFGHMWELYALWAYIPRIIKHYADARAITGLNISLVTFFVIASGAIGCVLGGEFAQRMGSARIAFTQLSASGALCTASVLLFHSPPALFFVLLMVWGITVAGDSPQFSTLVAASAPKEYVGTAFTIINCIGFATTAISIHLLEYLAMRIPFEFVFLALAPGPLMGLVAGKRLFRRQTVNVVLNVQRRHAMVQKQPMILGIGGTLREGSSSERALRVALNAARENGAVVSSFTGVQLDLPHYDPQNKAGIAAASELLELYRKCDGVIIASPGYHGSMSGMIKNALDYIEELRNDERVYLQNIPVGCIVCAYGWQATGSTLMALRSVVHALRGWPTPLGVTINSSQTTFDTSGVCSDARVTEQLYSLAAQVTDFARNVTQREANTERAA